jgi:hypothetical protein
MKRVSVVALFLFCLSLLLLLSCDKVTSETMSFDPYLYYPFDGNVTDYGNTQNNGIDSTHGVYVTGIKGKALDFNGKTDFIILKYPVNFSNGLTFSFWIKSRGYLEGENNGCIISKYSMSGRRSFFINSFGYQLQVSRNEIKAYFFPDGYSTKGQEWIGSNTTKEEITALSFNPDLWSTDNLTELKLNTWTHCVVNCTSSSIEIWLDGKLTSSKVRENSSYFDSQDEPVVIGNILHGGEGKNNHFNGILDELKIFNYSLSQEEIQYLSQR